MTAQRRDFRSPCPLDEREISVSLCVNPNRICRHFRGSVTITKYEGNVLCAWPGSDEREPLPDYIKDWSR